ncbi:MAG TPA: type II secretion system F family protein [Glaciihabitans sp.]|jgi:tight adherence protein B|nr:type II secretion system F family protein [Glaciihabitans sp.]
MRFRRRVPQANVSRVAAVAQRLAVLLAAGVPPNAAWGYLREGELPTRIASAIAGGVAVPDAIVVAVSDIPPMEADAWRGLAMAWAVATEAGAPLAPTLREFAGALRSIAAAQRDIRVALAEPTATARLVMVLPLVGVLFGAALGFNTLTTLTTTVPGWMCLGVGTALLFAASRWNRSLVNSAQPTDITPGLPFDLTAIAVSGGGALGHARQSVARAMKRYGRQDVGGAGGGAVVSGVDSDAGIDDVLDLSVRAGVPAAELLRSEAEERRRVARAEVQERAAALSVRLMLPLGLCVLPAFMVIGVLPLAVTVFTTTNIGF